MLIFGAKIQIYLLCFSNCEKTSPEIVSCRTANAMLIAVKKTMQKVYFVMMNGLQT